MKRIVTLLAALCLSGGVFAQSWPNKPVKVIVPLPPMAVTLTVIAPVPLLYAVTCPLM